MLQQTLIYYVSGSTAVLQGEGNNLIFGNVTLNISGSEYETGGPFASSIGTIRIYLYSGSVLIADFPYDQTNLIINSSSTLFTTSSANITLVYQTQLNNVDPNSSYYFKIIESSSLNELVDLGLPLGTNGSSTPAISSSKYIIELYSGDNKYNQLYLYDATSSLLATSSWIIGSGSFIIEPTGSSLYTISTIVSGAVCCVPTLTSIEGLGYERLKFTYETGTCGTFDSMSVFQSTDQVNWNLLATGSSTSTIISDSGSYPISTSYYKLEQHCNDGIDMFNSDPSNVLTFSPSITPNIPNYYYVTIVGRNSPGSNLSREFLYSPDSGSTNISLGSLNYTPYYSTITSFFIYSGSMLFLNPNFSYNFGVGYNGAFSGYCGCVNNVYTQSISSNTTIYLNLDTALIPCC